MQLDCKEQQLTEACSQRDEITDKYNDVSQRVSISIRCTQLYSLNDSTENKNG